MNASTLDRDLRSRIDTFVAELSAMVKASAVQAVQEALGAGAPARRGPGRPRKNASGAAAPARRGRRGKRSSEDVQAMADQVLAYVKSNPGSRLEQISAGMAVPSKDLKLPVAKLLEGALVHTEGRKRGTKYFAGGGRGAAKRGAKTGRRKK
jgi:hypothetical protein